MTTDFCFFFLRLIRRLALHLLRQLRAEKDRQRPRGQHQRERIPQSASGIVVLLCYVRGLSSLFGLGSPFGFFVLAGSHSR